MTSLEDVVRTLEPAAALDLPGDAFGLRAAVAAILRQGPTESEILFIRRADRTGDPWSGHMAFPGGRRQLGDPSLLDTAKRETLEEVGVDLTRSGRPIARLPDIMPYSKMPEPITVSAFVFALEQPALVTLNEEVAEAVWTPLGEVLRGDHATTFRWQRDGMDLELPALDLQGRIVWGLTYRMLELLREALKQSVSA